MSRLFTRSLVLAALAVAVLPAHAYASLTTFQSYTGTVGYSTDGFGSLSNTGTISASVPAGSTVLAAYLYTATNNNQTHSGVGSTLNGSAVTYGPAVPNPNGFLASARADVTATVAAVINGGPGGIYNFTVTEASSSQDGEALVVVYSNPALPIATVGILDGFSNVAGDSTAINFLNPLDPTAPGFFAEMVIGDSFSCCGQMSTIAVNGTTITNSAGNHDDGADQANGSLITVGGFNDPFSPMLPSYENDHERYNLVPFITLGNTSINIFTRNPSTDDNIFLAAFYVSGIAGINEPPPTGVPDQGDTLMLMGLGLAVLGVASFRRV